MKNEEILAYRYSCYFYFIGWWNWSLGFHINPSIPNIEIHLPFGFIRIGRETYVKVLKSNNKVIGYEGKWKKYEQSN
jgi:hypothetical protein